VLSTRHTNEAAGAPTRLSNMGLEGFIIASALKAVLSQRLLRRLCKRCAAPAAAPDGLDETLGFSASGLEAPSRVWRASAKGCEHCRGGYKGRVVAAELLVVDDAIASAIVERAPSNEVDRLARAAGSVSMRRDALEWVLAGETSVEEVQRVGV